MMLGRIAGTSFEPGRLPEKEQIMKRIVYSFLLATSMLVAAGCSTWDKFNSTEKGAVIGGGTGVAIGNVVAPGIGGTIVGGAAGAGVGALAGHEYGDDRRRHRD